MGSICQSAENEQQKMNQAFIKVLVKNIPNKQQYLEKYTYDLQENMDRFEEDFFQKSFHLELLNQNPQIAELSDNLSLHYSSQNNSIELQQNSQDESVKESSSIANSENNCLYKQSQKWKLQSRNKKSHFSNSPLRSILKVPSSHQRINFHSSEIYNLKKKKVRFRISDKVSNSLEKRRSEKQMITLMKRSQNNKYY